MQRIARTSGYNVVLDAQAGENLPKITAELNNVPVDTAARLLADMAGLKMVRLDNVFYVTTEQKAKRLREEQEKINVEMLMGGAGRAPAPASDKPAK